MAATIDIRVPVDQDEHAKLKKRAGGAGLAAFFRALAGLPPRERGRPKSDESPPPASSPAPKRKPR